MSFAVTSSADIPRAMRKRFGSRLCRTETCPQPSSRPWSARIRLAATRSSISCGSGGPAEFGAGCAPATLKMHVAASASKIARPLRRGCSQLIMTNSNAEEAASGLQFGIPIEIVEPALVQVIRGEQSTIPMQVMHGGLERHLRRPHPRFAGREVAFAQVAGRASSHDIVPSGVPTARTRQQMIEGEVVAVATILTGEAVAQKHVKAGESRVRRRLYEGLERNNAGQFHLEGRAVDRAVVIGDDVHALEENRLDRVLPGPQR